MTFMLKNIFKTPPRNLIAERASQRIGEERIMALISDYLWGRQRTGYGPDYGAGEVLVRSMETGILHNHELKKVTVWSD